MLRSMSDMETCSIAATDGVIGLVKDLYFSESDWVIRYLSVVTDAWLSNRRVVISPIAIGRFDWSTKIFPTSTTRERVKQSPCIDTAGLRSGNAILKYHVHATNGDIGHIQGMIVDEETWAIRYLTVNTSNWWLGHQVLIAVKWIEDVNWLTSKVSVSLSRQEVEDAPEYDPRATLNREQELHIHKHYGRVGYWRPESVREAPGSQPHAGRPSPEVLKRRQPL